MTDAPTMTPTTPPTPPTSTPPPDRATTPPCPRATRSTTSPIGSPPGCVGKPLERVTTQGLVRALASRTVTSVTAHGKHLVIELDDGTYLRMHLGMYGRFRAYSRAEGDAVLAWMSPGRATLAVTTADGVYIWIGARTVEISPRRAPMHAAPSRRSAPTSSPTTSIPPSPPPARPPSPRAIADALLDQRIAAGIGNVYKSEVLFLRGVDPRTRIGALAPAQLEAIYATARDLMLQNLRPGRAPRAATSPARPPHQRPTSATSSTAAGQALPSLRDGARGLPARRSPALDVVMPTLPGLRRRTIVSRLDRTPHRSARSPASSLAGFTADNR